MSNFFKNSITMKGAVAIAAIISGKKMEFTRMAVGDGNLSGGQTPMTMTGLANPLFNVNIHEIYYDSESQVTIKGSFSNKDLLKGFFYRELGLFATDPVTGEEILFCYGNAGENAEWINPAGEGSVIEKEVHIVTLVGNTENVTATIKSGIYPTITQMNTLLSKKADLDATNTEGGRVVPEQMRFDADQVLYVDAAAAKDGDGSESKPFKTIQAAVNAAYAGADLIRVNIKAGTYAEDVVTPTARRSAWIFEKIGEGVATVKSIKVEIAPYARIQGLTFTPATGGIGVQLVSVTSAAIESNTITSDATGYGIYITRSGARVNANTINGAGHAVFASEASRVVAIGTKGKGNTNAFTGDGAVIQCHGNNTIAAVTKYRKTNAGAINVEGGATSFPSNYSQLYSLGDFADAEALKATILAELAKLGIGESLDCWFANNIAAGFGPFGSGQRMQVKIIKSTDAENGYGTALFTSHHSAARGYMQIQNGAFATTAPIKFADAVDLTNYLPLAGGEMRGEIRTNGGQHFPAVKNVSGGELWLFDKDDEQYKGGFILRAISTEGDRVTTDLEGHFGGELQWGGRNIARSVNGYNADETGAITIPTATASTYGVVKVATGDMVIDPDANDAAITPAVYHDVSDFRHKNTAYNVGDIVRCMFNSELFLECTKAGTTSAEPIDTRTVKHDQILEDGTLQWTVRTYIKSINGNVAAEDGNVTLEIKNNWNDLEGKPNFHAVATSGNYNDLINKPAIPANPNSYIIDSWRSGSSWYRKWSNGFVEQGGYIYSIPTGNQNNTLNYSTIKLHVPFNHKNYFASMFVDINEKHHLTDLNPTIWKKSNTEFTTRNYDPGNVDTCDASWYACGYL